MRVVHCEQMSEAWFQARMGLLVYPLFGWKANVVEVSGLTVIFTLLSMVRSYGVRRLFVWLKEKGVLA